MATCLVNAIEGRDVPTADILGAFLQATMNEDVCIKFEGEMVDVLLELDPKRYGPCVCHYKGRKFLYVRAVKAICVSIAILSAVLRTTVEVGLRTK